MKKIVSLIELSVMIAKRIKVIRRSIDYLWKSQIKVFCENWLQIIVIEEDENVNGFTRIDRKEGGVAFLNRAFQSQPSSFIYIICLGTELRSHDLDARADDDPVRQRKTSATVEAVPRQWGRNMQNR